MKKTVAILLAILMTTALTQRIAAQQRQYLHEGWTFGQARQPQRYPAVVPGVVHTDLLRQGLIADPYIGLNERTVQWIDKEDWIYETTFRVDDTLMAADHIALCFDGLDTYADVYLNDIKILEADNMFRRWSVSVKPALNNGDNVLRIFFHSPIKVDMPKWEQHPHLYQAANDQSENGGVLDRKLSVFARKAGYHYGWDWGPRLVTIGIWRNVYLQGWSKVRITDTNLRQEKVSKQKATITDVVEIEADEDVSSIQITVTDQAKGQLVAAKKCRLRKGLNTIPVTFSIKNPRLWWCNGLGKPELYTFTTRVFIDGKQIEQQQKRIGIRTIQLVTEPDADGNKQFYFVLNGVPVFAKGTNYIPQDNFLTNVTPERYRRTLQDAVLANMNMVRVWGGGIYENDLFYDLCDEMGLMVWQDFMFACSTYPVEGEWMENVRQEAIDNIRRLRHHPSIVLWCGGNECMDAWYNWGWKTRMEKANPTGAQLVGQQQEYLYYDLLQQVVDEQIPDHNYVTGSPLADRGRGSDGINGDRHFYGVGHRHMPVSSYEQEKAHFFSEYGMQSFPEYASVLSFAPDISTHSIDSELMMWHQRGGVEANKTIAWYVDSEYPQPRDFQQFLYTSQLLQGDAMRTAIEAHRRDMPHCMGSLLWQHNDCWPVASWSTRDYYGRWKAAHYMVRHAFEPLICSAVSEGDSLTIYTVSDLLNPQKGTLKLTVYTLDGKTIGAQTHSLTIVANTSAAVLRLSVDQLLQGRRREEVVVSLSLTTVAGRVYQSNCFLCQQKNLRLQPANPSVQVEAAEGGCRLTLKADTFVRAVALSTGDADCWLDNNYFDLLPGVPTSCFLRTSLTTEEVKRKLTVSSLNDNLFTH